MSSASNFTNNFGKSVFNNANKSMMNSNSFEASDDDTEVIKKKLSKAKIFYDPDEIEKYHDPTTLLNIFENLLEEDKKLQDQEIYDLKPKLVFTEIDVHSFTQKFTPKFMIPFGFIHAAIKIGPIVNFFNFRFLIFIQEFTLD